jgi:hypothetical protein
MSMCDDQRVPKPATGKTPVRNARIPDEVWLPAVAKAEMEGRSASEAMTEALRKWAAEPGAPAFGFTYANWPGAKDWALRHASALDVLTRELNAAWLGLPSEWIAIAAWLASTRHPADEAQQRRVLAGHVIGRAIATPADAAWRARFRDTRHLLDTVQAILDERMPVSED